MKYRGFDMKPVEHEIPPHKIMVRGIGIFRGERCLTYAHDYELAKRTVDDHLKSGVWKMEGKEHGR